MDLPLALVLLMVPCLCLATVFPMLAAGGWIRLLTALFIIAFGAALPLSALLATWYDLDDHHLQIRSGLFKWTIPLETITGIVPTKNPLSSPALSFDRLSIRYGRGTQVMVSPKRKTEFIAALEEKIAERKLKAD